MKTRIALIACSKTKMETDTAVPAGELYQGQLFKAQLAYARQVLRLPDHGIYVLSAKHGIVRLANEILPYERTLNEMYASERRMWGMAVSLHLGIVFGSAGRVFEIVYVLAGQLYAQPVRDALASLSTGVRVPHPPGMGYAQQVQWYKEEVNKVSGERN